MLHRDSSNKYIVVGRFGKTYGLKGWLRINSETEPFTNILNYQPWFLKQQQYYKEIKVTDNLLQGEALLAHIEGFDTPEDAKSLAGQCVFVERNKLPHLANGEFYWAELEGLEVITITNTSLGIVDHLMEAGACDVMVVKGSCERLIPFDMNNVVKEVNIEQRKIIVEWDEDF